MKTTNNRTMKTYTMKKNKKETVIYKGVVITKLSSGKYRWFRDNELSLDECKAEIDAEFGGKSPLGDVFTIEYRQR